MYILRGKTIRMCFLEGKYIDGSFNAGITKKLGICIKIGASRN